MHHAYGVDALLIIRLIKASHTEHLITIIPCYVISNKFPRLLAEREIIANALFLPTMSGSWHKPNPTAKIQRTREFQPSNNGKSVPNKKISL